QHRKPRRYLRNQRPMSSGQSEREPVTNRVANFGQSARRSAHFPDRARLRAKHRLAQSPAAARVIVDLTVSDVVDLLRIDRLAPFRFKLALLGRALCELAVALPHPRLDFDFEINRITRLERYFGTRFLVSNLKHVVPRRNGRDEYGAVADVN